MHHYNESVLSDHRASPARTLPPFHILSLSLARSLSHVAEATAFAKDHRNELRQSARANMS